MRKNWNEEEIMKVVREFKKEDPSLIFLSEVLKRTKSSIYSRARRLGLTSLKHCGKKKGIPHPWALKNSPYKPGKKHIFWKGGIIRGKEHGYVYIYKSKHPHRIGNYVKEHRLVMEKCLGRYLEPSEAVHHRNGIKDDNRIENLELVKIAHLGKVVCPFCRKEFSIK